MASSVGRRAGKTWPPVPTGPGRALQSQPGLEAVA
ncbi:hypothetical protein SFR_2503 [Streptomyces sp. FR-008]|nr:hypothetical protein SFR_2503 [Streptomyces sp. FR-008]